MWKDVLDALSSIHLSDPGNFRLAAVALAFVLAFGLVALWFFFRVRKRYGNPRLVNTFSSSVRVVSSVASLVSLLLVPALIGAAIVGPYRNDVPHRVPAGKQDVVVGFQDSRGMGTVDYPGLSGKEKLQFFHETGSDLDAARYLVQQGIMPAIAGNQLAVVVYQGGAIPLVDLTDAFDIIDKTLDKSLKIGMAPVGTAQVNGKVSSVAAFLEVALEEFDQWGVEGHDKVIVIFSKGDDVSDPDWLAKEVQQVRERHIKVIIIGLGGPPALIPIYGGENEQFLGYYQFKDGTQAMSGIDEGNLQKLAADLGGEYIRFDPANPPKIDWVEELTSWKLEMGRQLLFSWPARAAYLLIILLGTGGYLWRGFQFTWSLLFRRRQS